MKVIQRNTKRYFALKRLQEECNVKLKCDTLAEEFFNETFPEQNPALMANSPLNFPTSSLPQCVSPAKTASRHFGFLSSLPSRAGSWFDPLETKPDQFTPENYFSAPCAGQMTFNFTRGHVSPLAMLMCNFSPAKPRVDDADKLSLTMLSVNKSSAIISRRDIEKVTCLYESVFVQAEQCLRYYTESIPSVPLWKIGWGGGKGVQVCNRGLLAVSKSVTEFQDTILL